ncbi:MAG: hypothetical protein IKP28_06830 [Clostridia bacterium]|nr:hypothetical protein [Clostridia bacterium]
MKKVFAMFLIMIIVVLLPFNKSFATGTFTLTITPNKTAVRRGGTVELTVALSNVTATGGIAGLIGKLEYDHSVFEKIELIEVDNTIIANGIVTGENWETISYNDGSQVAAKEGMFVTNTSGGTGLTTGATVMTITLKVLSTATIGATTVRISQLVGSDGSTDITIANPISVAINIEERSTRRR